MMFPSVPQVVGVEKHQLGSQKGSLFCPPEPQFPLPCGWQAETDNFQKAF